ncbi:MAG: nucleotide-binding protein [Candidatus Omnitrophota bacterium]|jgi:hypothetical protein
MYYHIRITQKSNRRDDEVKVDLSKKVLLSQFIIPYEKGAPITINGKTIMSNDIERIRVSESEKNSSQILPIIEEERRQSSVAVIGGPSDEWEVAARGRDITDDLIKGPPGYKISKKGEGLNETKFSNQIFIVHGHNEQAKKELALILHNLGFEPIILHEQANQGMTLIEKLEKHSNVGFAFILLTPDDTVIGSGPSVNEIVQEEGRARQNVVFEFGLFIGKLGRNRACCLYTGDVKLPSDLEGLVYIRFENTVEEVELKIMRELKAAGYRVKL